MENDVKAHLAVDEEADASWPVVLYLAQLNEDDYPSALRAASAKNFERFLMPAFSILRMIKLGSVTLIFSPLPKNGVTSTSTKPQAASSKSALLW